MACNLGSLMILVWMVVWDWMRVLDYAYWYSVCYQQTVFTISLCGCVFCLFCLQLLLCSVSLDKKNVDCYQWICFYLQIYIFSYDFQFSSLAVLLFFLCLPWETRKSAVCTAFFIRKTNLLDFNIKIGTWLSLSRFDQSLVRYCLSLNSVL